MNDLYKIWHSFWHGCLIVLFIFMVVAAIADILGLL